SSVTSADVSPSTRSDESLALSFDLVATPASLHMVVNETHCLHEGVDGRRTDETPAAPLQVLRQGSRSLAEGQRAQRGVIESFRTVRRIRLEPPEIGRQRAFLLPQS